MVDELIELTATIVEKKEIANHQFVFRLSVSKNDSFVDAKPGDHLTVETPAGHKRRYSICSQSLENTSYELVIKHEPEGRGGSHSMVVDTKIGDPIKISKPENEFEFVEGDSYLLIAGGIGITPIYSMWKSLVKQGHTKFKLIYLTKSAAHTLFLDEFNNSDFKDTVEIHHSNIERYDFWDLLMTPKEQHIYCCGPGVLITEIKDMTGHWPKRLVHFEDFMPVKAITKDDCEFSVRIKSTNDEIKVSNKQTMISALRDNGYKISSSCESGTCGSCKISYLSGVVEHRDLVLEPDERKNKLMACVSRSTGDEILLDL